MPGRRTVGTNVEDADDGQAISMLLFMIDRDLYPELLSSETV